MSSTTEGPTIVESSSNSAVTAIDSFVTNIVESIKVVISSTTTSTTTTASTSTVDSIASNPTSTSTATTSSLHSISDKLSEAVTTTTHPGMMNVAELSHSLQHFGIVDYLVFVLMLIICAVIGFYFGFIEKRKKKRNVDVRRGSEALDYLVGGRKMKVFPVALSLVASFVSGISLLGTSTEIYVYGTQYAFILITLAISGVISWYVFLPVFCNLQLTSTYEYFEMRFDKGIRLFGSVLFSVGTIFWLPIVIYVPALAFNQVTGVNIHIVTPAVCIVCIFYTCVGGLKAVVWTDVIQSIIMFGAILLTVIKGTMNVGGLDVVWQRNYDSGRIEAPEMTWDPTVRVSMFSMFFGTTIYYLQLIGGNQVIIQRYLSLPNLKAAKNALIVFIIGMTIIHCVCFYNGLLIFARYYDCDPLTTKLAKAADQLVPLMAIEILSVFPGLPGLFIAGVFSAALSSLSTGLNSLAAVFLEDFIKPFKTTPLTESQTAIVMRLSVLLIGVLCVALVFVVEHMGAVLQLSMTLNSLTSGPLLGLFMMGLTMPWINAKSALTGSIISFIIMTWISAKSLLAKANGELVYSAKPVSTEGCIYDFEAFTSTANSSLFDEGLNVTKPFSQYIYHMSFMLHVPAGAILTIVGACIASLRFGYNDPSKMNINLFSPFMQRFIKPVDYESVKPDEEIMIFGPLEGGLKAVVWTDVIQTVIMFGAILVILIKGTIDVGGLGVVWERNYESGRIELPTMTWDPTTRVSMLSMFIGTTLFFTQVCAGNQVIVQRYLSLPNLKAVKKALILFVIGITILNGVCFYNGLLIYATFHDCDPLTTKLTKAKDQLMPLLAMDVLSAYPGAPGLFVAGVFSAALSSLSTGLNSLSAVLLEDYIKPYKKISLTEHQTAVVMRISVVLLGILCLGLVFVVEHMGAVIQLSMTLSSITNGPLLGLFLMGLLLPWINGKSALIGSMMSFGTMSWICINAQLAMASGELVYAEKPVSTVGCTYSYDALISYANMTIPEQGSKTFSQYIYHMSFMFYAFVGAMLSIIFAFCASFIYGRNDPSKMNIELFAPIVRCFIKPEEYESVQPDEKTVIIGFEIKNVIKN